MDTVGGGIEGKQNPTEDYGIDEFHKVVPDYSRVADQLPWMPSSTFRSPLVLELRAA